MKQIVAACGSVLELLTEQAGDFEDSILKMFAQTLRNADPFRSQFHVLGAQKCSDI
jgi:hypothetical protein